MQDKAGRATETKADRSEQSGIVNEQAIRERAYEIYEERSKAGSTGDPIMDWLQAEHEFNDGRKRGAIRS